MPWEQVRLSGLADLPPGPELCSALAEIDISRVANGDVVAVLEARSRQRAHEDARFLAVVAEVGRRDPAAELDRVARLAEPARYAADETRAALSWTRRAAECEHDFAEVLTARLPLVFAAFDHGEVDRPKARVFVEHLADLAPRHVRTICQALLPKARGLTTGQLRARLARLAIAADPSRARDQYEKAVRDRSLVGYLSPDGTAVITAEGLPADDAAAACERLDRLARAAKRAGHPARLDQIRADVFIGLLDGRLHHLSRDQIIDALLGEAGANCAGQADADTAADSGGIGEVPGVEVRAELSTLLGYDERPGELPGWGPVPAHVARRVVARQRGAEWRFAVTDNDGYLLCGGVTRCRPESTTTARRGGTVELQIPATLLAALVADPPAGWAKVIADVAAQYTAWPARERLLDDRPGGRLPMAALRRHTQIRDRTCRGLGCRRSATRSQYDHIYDYQYGGPTVRVNGDMLCGHDHDLKSRGGWRLGQPRPGHFIWTSPLGRIYPTRGDPVIFPLPEPPPDDAPPPV